LVSSSSSIIWGGVVGRQGLEQPRRFVQRDMFENLLHQHGLQIVQHLRGLLFGHLHQHRRLLGWLIQQGQGFCHILWRDVLHKGRD
jgi:hypothetical protein